MDFRHVQYTGNNYASIGMQIDQDVPSHHHSRKAIQKLSIDQTLVRENWELVITNPDGGNFNLMFVSQCTGKIVETEDPISTNATASQMKAAVNGYFSSCWGNVLSVTLVMKDANGDVTSDPLESVENTYTFQINKSIPSASYMGVGVAKGTTASTFSYKIPS